MIARLRREALERGDAARGREPGRPRQDLARAILCSRPGDNLAAWLVEQRWRAAPDGSWVVEPGRGGWTFHVESAHGEAVRVVARAPAVGGVAAWLVG